LNYIDRVKLDRAVLKKDLPEMPSAPKSVMTKAEKALGHTPREEKFQLPLSESVRVQLERSRQEMLGPKSKQGGFKIPKIRPVPKKPTIKAEFYSAFSPDFPLEESKPSPELASVPGGVRMPERLSINRSTWSQWTETSRGLLHMESHNEWLELALDEMLTSGLKTDLSDPARVRDSMEAMLSLVKSLIKGSSDRLKSHSFMLWSLELAKREEILKSLTFKVKDSTRSRLLTAPLTATPQAERPSAATPSDSSFVFSGLAPLLAKEALEFRESKRDEVLFRNPGPPMKFQRKLAKPKKSSKPKVSASSSAATPQPQTSRDTSTPQFAKARKPFQARSGNKGGFPGRKGKTSGLFSRYTAFLDDCRGLASKSGFLGNGGPSRFTPQSVLESMEGQGGKSLGSYSVKERVLPKVGINSPPQPSTTPLFSTRVSSQAQSTGRGNPKHGREGSGRGSSELLSRVLQPRVRSSQELGRMETSHRSVRPKPTFGSSLLSDGNSGDHSVVITQGVLGSVSGPEGRLLPCSDQAIVQEVPSVCIQGEDLSVQGSSFRLSTSTLDLHDDRERGSSDGANAGFHPTSIPGRLDSKIRISSGLANPEGQSFVSSIIPRLRDQQGEVRTSTSSGLCIPGLQVPDSNGDCDSVSRQTYEVGSHDQTFPVSFSSSGSALAVPSGPLSCNGEDGTSREVFHETSSVLSAKPMVSGTGLPRRVDFDRSGVSSGSTLVVRRGEPPIRLSLSTSGTRQSSVHRCFDRRLGCSPQFSGGIRHLGPPVVGFSHQSPRTPSSRVGIDSLVTSTSTSFCPSSDRQFHSRFLHQQTGGDQIEVPVSVSLPTDSLDSIRANHSEGPAYSGQTQRSCRCTIAQGSDSSPGVVAKSNDFPSTLLPMGHSDGRSVCNSMEQQASLVHFADPRSQSLGGRCPHLGLERHVCLCLPSNSTDATGLSQDQSISVQSTLSSTSVEGSSLVSRPSGTLDRVSQSSSSASGSTQTTQVLSVSLPSGIPEAPRVALVEQRLRDQGFSQSVSSRIAQSNRRSSLAVYESKWRIFDGWCRERQVDPITASVARIADFLADKFQEGKAYSTLAGYRTAIAKTLSHFRAEDLGQNAQLSALLRNFEQSSVGRQPRRVEWDLSVVLNALSKSPFEPMGTAHLKLVTWKTAFLTMLASARRGGEVHAFLHRKVRWGTNDSYVALGVDPSFVAKSKLSTESLRSVKIPALGSSLSESLDSDLVLCPVRAIRVYLDKTQAHRKGTSRLFVSYSRFKKGDITKVTFASWIKKLIRLCYELVPNSPSGPFKVRAHDVRAVASSMAFLRHVPLKEVMEAASWATHNTFTNFYLQDVVERSESEGAVHFISALHKL